eukprot:g2876.t1
MIVRLSMFRVLPVKILNAAHTDEVTRRTCIDVRQFIEALAIDVESSADGALIKLVGNKVAELCMVVQGIQERSTSLRVMMSFTPGDLEKIDKLRAEIAQYQTAANANQTAVNAKKLSIILQEQKVMMDEIRTGLRTRGATAANMTSAADAGAVLGLSHFLLYDFRKCVVQLGIFDRNEKKVVSWGSGSVISAHGHILTAAHVVQDFLGGKDGHAVLVGVFEDEERPTRWSYSCTIVSDEEALQLKAADKSLVDLAVLQIKAKVIEANPPVFDGSLDSLTIKERTIVPANLHMRYLRTSKAKLLGDCNVRLFGYPKQRGTTRLTRENATAAVQGDGWVKVNATAVATSGLSGGPLLNDTGEIVAVMSIDYNDKKGHDQALKAGAANLSWFRHLSMIQPGHLMPQLEEELPINLAVDAKTQTASEIDMLKQRLSELEKEEKVAAANTEQDKHSDKQYELAKEKLHTVTQAGLSYDQRQLASREACARLEDAIKGTISPERMDRAKRMLPYAYYAAGFCKFRLRKYHDARKSFEMALGEVKDKEYVQGLSEVTAKKARKFGVYCSYALGKEAMREGRCENAKKEFMITVDTAHYKWLELWCTDRKDYVELVKEHVKECDAAIECKRLDVTKDTAVMAWAEANGLATKGMSRKVQVNFDELMKQNS